MSAITRTASGFGAPVSARGVVTSSIPLDEERPRRRGGVLHRTAHRSTFRPSRLKSMLLSLGFDVYRARR